jgi:hypothetical protein
MAARVIPGGFGGRLLRRVWVGSLRAVREIGAAMRGREGWIRKFRERPDGARLHIPMRFDAPHAARPSRTCPVSSNPALEKIVELFDKQVKRAPAKSP